MFLFGSSAIIVILNFAEVFLPLLEYLFHIKMFISNDGTNTRRIQTRITYSSRITEDGKRYGYCFGKWYCALIRDLPDNTFSVYIITTAQMFSKLTNDIAAEETKPAEKTKPAEQTIAHKLIQSLLDPDSTNPDSTNPTTAFHVIECPINSSSSYNMKYRRRTIVNSYTPRLDQAAIMDSIIEQFNRTGHAVAFLYGPPGTGKSMMGPLLAAKLKGVYCNTLQPWKNALLTISELYEESKISSTSPLILAFDEVDVALMAIHSRTNGKQSNSIFDKTDWNRMLDEFSRGLFPHVILLLTTNKTPDFINDLDPSFIRADRVDQVFHVLGPASPIATTCRTLLIVERGDPTYSSTEWCRRTIPISIMPRLNQQHAVESIFTDFKTKGSTVVFLHGSHGIGKSTVGPLVATQLGAVFCNSLRPWESSESLGVLCTNLQINVHKPLVIVFDDIDVAITKIHRNDKLMQVQKHASTNAAHKPLQIADRSDWTQFLDNIQQGIYPHQAPR